MQTRFSLLLFLITYGLALYLEHQMGICALYYLSILRITSFMSSAQSFDDYMLTNFELIIAD